MWLWPPLISPAGASWGQLNQRCPWDSALTSNRTPRCHHAGRELSDLGFLTSALAMGEASPAVTNPQSLHQVTEWRALSADEVAGR